MWAAATAVGVRQRRDRLAALAARRTTLADRRAELVAERDRIAAEHDDAPPAPVTRRAARAGRPGAPLWRLVRFTDAVTGADAAAIEAALHAAGLLDAWLHPGPDDLTTGLAGDDLDGYLLPLPPGRRPTGPTLADVLTAEDHDDVPAARITDVLASIALADAVTPEATAPVVVGVDGRYAQGVGVGRFAKMECEYIGATARAARRAARIAECDRMLAVVEADLDAVDRDRAADEELLVAVDAAGAQLPPISPIHAALRELDRAAATLRARQESAAAAASRLDQALAERAAAAAALRRATAERS
ncbi:TIGR02680 family protein, partial [Micromonospora sp. ATA32]|nr:TIGR02680 family protein [Micromonospora sp. ATA32]